MATFLDDELNFLHPSSVENGLEESAVDDFATPFTFDTGQQRLIRSQLLRGLSLSRHENRRL